tara:strand:- start:5501 stop:7345 length:1845 start_codon:yes stop_codon:yes gene_type:complete
MCAFFKQFPNTTLDIYGDGSQYKMTDIFRSADVTDTKLDDLTTYIDHVITDGERPDVVSQRLYGDPNYHWTFFVVNDWLKEGMIRWPLSEVQVEKHINQIFKEFGIIRFDPTAAFSEGYYNFEHRLTGIDLQADNVRVVDNNGFTYPLAVYDSDLQELGLLKGGVGKLLATNLDSLTDEEKTYIIPPPVKFTGGGDGHGAAGEAVLDESGIVIDVRIKAEGKLYTRDPSATFDITPTREASIRCETDVGGTPTFTIEDGGLGYFKAPQMTISTGLSNITLASGLNFLSTDGVDDKAINADCSALGPGTYRITGKVRQNGPGAYRLAFATFGVGFVPIVEGEWQEFVVTSGALSAAAMAATGTLRLGTDGYNYSNSDWADVRLIDVATGDTVAHWDKLGGAGNLDGVAAIDSVGGFNGVHVGCTGPNDVTLTLSTTGVIETIVAASPFQYVLEADTRYTVNLANVSSTILLSATVIDCDLLNTNSQIEQIVSINFDIINPHTFATEEYEATELVNAEWIVNFNQWLSVTRELDYIQLVEAEFTPAQIVETTKFNVGQTDSLLWRWQNGANAHADESRQSYAEMLYKLNDSKKSIKIVRPEYIERFARAYRKKINA